MHLINVSNFGVTFFFVRHCCLFQFSIFAFLVLKMYLLTVMFCQFFCDSSRNLPWGTAVFVSECNSSNIEYNWYILITIMKKVITLSQVSATIQKVVKSVTGLLMNPRVLLYFSCIYFLFILQVAKLLTLRIM